MEMATSGSACQPIFVIIPTLIIHQSFTLSLEAQNLPFQHLLTTLIDFVAGGRCRWCLSVVVQCIERSLLLLVTSASDLPLHTIKFCFVLFSSLLSSMLVVISKELLMRGGLCGKLHGGGWKLLFALHESSIG